MADAIHVKHAFFAFEACEAGAIFYQMLGSDALPPNGYILGADAQRKARQFVTAGNAIEPVPAGKFTDALVAGLDAAEAADGCERTVYCLPCIRGSARSLLLESSRTSCFGSPTQQMMKATGTFACDFLAHS